MGVIRLSAGEFHLSAPASNCHNRPVSGARAKAKGIWIPLESLQPWNPFEHAVWRNLVRPITREEVRLAIERGRLRRTQLGVGRETTTRRAHVNRVAYLVVNPSDDPIDIEVGVPELTGREVDWVIQDGNHRLAAAFYRGDAKVRVDIGGSIAHASKLFNVKLYMQGNEVLLDETV